MSTRNYIFDMESILQLNGTTEKNNSLMSALQKKPALQQKPFIWDNVIFILASSIFGLSISGIIIELFQPEKYTVACFSPFGNRAQYTYINSYCHKYIPIAEYFAVALMLHVAALVIPHHLWKAFFSAQIDCFFRHASRLETLRDRDTGKYPRKNYDIVNYLQREFNDKKTMLRSYIAKLVMQFVLILIAIAANWYVFRGIDSDITFECYDDHKISQLFSNVTCAYPRKLFINVLQVVDYSLLVAGIFMLIIGLLWSFLHNHATGDDTIAEFCYNSSIDPKYYYYKSSKKWLGWCQMKSDFVFLLGSLLESDTGARRVFKAILIEDAIFEIFSTQLAAFENRRPNTKGIYLHMYA